MLVECFLLIMLTDLLMRRRAACPFPIAQPFLAPLLYGFIVACHRLRNGVGSSVGLVSIPAPGVI